MSLYRLDAEMAWTYIQRAAQEPGVAIKVPRDLFNLIWALAIEDPRLKGSVHLNSRTHDFYLDLDRPLVIHDRSFDNEGAFEGPRPPQTCYDLIGAEGDWLGRTPAERPVGGD